MENNDGRTSGRNLQYVSVLYNREKYLISNFHGLWNAVDKLDSDDRIQQSQKIKDFIGKRKEQHKIIMGDFNLAPATKSIGMLECDMRNLIKEYEIKSTRTSFYTKSEKFADYAFVSPEINVKDFKVLPEEVSDHSALLLEI